MTNPRELARGYHDKARRVAPRSEPPTARSPRKLVELAREFDEQAAAIEKTAKRNSP